MRSLPELGRRTVVYVDAKIIGIHDKRLPRTTFVGFVVRGAEELHGETEVDALETDEAEEQAILFAMRSLQEKHRKLTIVCDHESAVTKVNWKGDDRKKAKNDRVLPKVWAEMDACKSIRVEALTSNPAHRSLNKWLKDQAAMSKANETDV